MLSSFISNLPFYLPFYLSFYLSFIFGKLIRIFSLDEIKQNKKEIILGKDTLLILLSQKKRLEMIKNHPLFFLLSKEDLNELESLLYEINVPAGTVIVKENDLVDSVYFIANGEAEVTREMSYRKKISGNFGSKIFHISAFIYNSKEMKEDIEPKSKKTATPVAK